MRYDYLIALPFIILSGCASDEPVSPSDAGAVVIPTWHDDVATFDIKREGKVVASFYLDL